MRATWDIFCTVIDNFGDIGVSWRLARQLVAEHDQEVRLWVDDLDTFCRLNPEADNEADTQMVEGVALHRWSPIWQPVLAADVVIEAFACQLPPAYIESMAQRPSPSLWLNLEYLSAEDWVDGCHGLPSLQSAGLNKFFYFPGFTPQTGGLMRESGLIEQRREFQQGHAAQQDFLQRLGVVPQTDAQLISLFAYDNPSLAGWLETLAAAEKPIHLLVPEGKIIMELKRWLALDHLDVGDTHTREMLTLQILPFLSQQDYDRLLWSCALNIVRGEDSFVRAQWAGRPLIWHIYPQQEDVHLKKLDAFLALYMQGLSPGLKTVLQSQWHAWNSVKDVQNDWQAFLDVLPELTMHAEDWCRRQSDQTNIAAAMVQIHQNWLECATKISTHPPPSGHN